jgi:hypothetical protein
MRKPNSQECAYFGRKLSSIVCDDIYRHVGWDLCIGSDQDDEIYFPPVLKSNEVMLKERVMISVESDSGAFCEIDLEDVLRFARLYCNGIYERVLTEVNPYKE